MSKQWWYLFFLTVVADGPASVLVWWYLWQWRTVAGLGGKLARYMSLMALGHFVFTVSWHYRVVSAAYGLYAMVHVLVLVGAYCALATTLGARIRAAPAS